MKLASEKSLIARVRECIAFLYLLQAELNDRGNVGKAMK
jgi:hypothetical protein